MTASHTIKCMAGLAFLALGGASNAQSEAPPSMPRVEAALEPESLLDRAASAEATAEKIAPVGTDAFAKARMSAFKELLKDYRKLPTDLKINQFTEVERDKRTLDAIIELFGNAHVMIRGTDDERDLFPETVAVKGDGQICSGVLISPNVVLTAQHCHCNGATASVEFRTNFGMTSTNLAVAKSVPMGKCALAAGDQQLSQSEHAKGSDFALLFLSGEAPVTPASLVRNTMEIKPEMIWAVGYGITELGPADYGRRRYAGIGVTSLACRDKVGAKPDSEFYGCVPDREFVAIDKKSRRDTCKGDSGGPTYVVRNNQYVVAGITSRAIKGAPLGSCGDGGIYESIDERVLKWISDAGVPVTTIA